MTARKIRVSARKVGPEHWQAALRLGFGRFVLQNVPALGQNADRPAGRYRRRSNFWSFQFLKIGRE
jgi:hypothetical protein